MNSPKTVLDHINQIKSTKSPDYISHLNESEMTGFSKYVVLMGLSMDQAATVNVAIISKYMYILPIKEFYRVCCDMIPQNRSINKWIKNKTPKLNLELSNILCAYFVASRYEAKEYYSMLIKTDDGVNELVTICRAYGHSDTEIEKILGI